MQTAQYCDKQRYTLLAARNAFALVICADSRRKPQGTKLAALAITCELFEQKSKNVSLSRGTLYYLHKLNLFQVVYFKSGRFFI